MTMVNIVNTAITVERMLAGCHVMPSMLLPCGDRQYAARYQNNAIMGFTKDNEQKNWHQPEGWFRGNRIQHHEKDADMLTE